jgi:hypothetical protein
MSNNLLLDYITPDWQITWDTKQITYEIPGFEFKGPGWYHKDNTWMLIVPTKIQEVYTIQVFFDRDPRGGFAAIAEAPVRADLAVKAATSNITGLLVLLIGMVVMIPLFAFLIYKFGINSIFMIPGILVVFSIIMSRINKSKNYEKKT